MNLFIKGYVNANGIEAKAKKIVNLLKFNIKIIDYNGIIIDTQENFKFTLQIKKKNQSAPLAFWDLQKNADITFSWMGFEKIEDF